MTKPDKLSIIGRLLAEAQLCPNSSLESDLLNAAKFIEDIVRENEMLRGNAIYESYKHSENKCEGGSLVDGIDRVYCGKCGETLDGNLKHQSSKPKDNYSGHEPIDGCECSKCLRIRRQIQQGHDRWQEALDKRTKPSD